MKRHVAAAVLLLLTLMGASGSAGEDQSSRAADHVVLVSIDGLRPEFYLDGSWPAPMLQQLAREGAHAESVRGVFPSVTYPSHTTMITGVLPARHGVHYNTPFEPGGQTGRWYWEEELIEVPTLWDAARAAGLTTASLVWPVSVGAPVDFNLPEVWSLEEADDPVEYQRAFCNPADFMAELEREATGRLRRESFSYELLGYDDRIGAAAAYVLETYRPNLMTVHLVSTDQVQHADGRESPRVRRAVATVDRALSKIWEAAQRAGILDRTVFVVTGDHGHVDRHTKLAPNVWLVEAGLMEASPDRGNWRATFHTTGASAFLHLADPGDSEAIEVVRRTLDGLAPGVRGLFRVVERAGLDMLDAAPEAVFALALEPGVDATSAADGPAVRAAHGATHGYLPDVPHVHTGLVASGAAVKPGAAASRIRLTDVAPLIAHLLDLELDAVDGVAPLGFIMPPVDTE